MKLEKVSVICLCYNHASYVAKSLNSVAAQTYANIELIVINDASIDDSKEQIERTVDNFGERFGGHPTVLHLDDNVGNCRAFNKGLALSSGDYVIDLAADDVMRPDRVQKQMEAFRRLDDTYGVIYSDAEYIDGQDASLGISKVPNPVEGLIYADLVRRYFIPPPTMMIKRSVLTTLRGYDETLAYEDFDFWVRSSRYFKYAYLPEPLTLIRQLEDSLSSKFYEKTSPLANSTYRVCEKVWQMNETDEEQNALADRVRYERRQCALLGNRQLAGDYRRLLAQVSHLKWSDWIVDAMIWLPLDWSWILTWRHALRKIGN